MLLESMLGSAGMAARSADSATSALRSLRSEPVDVVLLDRWLPEVDGIDLIGSLRAASPGSAIIMLSASGDVDARVRGLRAGADDFIAKPFHVSEVIARIDAVLRRSVSDEFDDDLVHYDDLVLDRAAHRVSRSGEPIILTPTELRLLRFLLENRERVLSRGQILDEVWQYDFGGRGEVIEKVISNLRRKVDGGRTPLIHTVRGFGYCLRRDP